jgi:hypothetical protein
MLSGMDPNLFSMGMEQYARSEFAKTALVVNPSPKSHSSVKKSSKHGPEMESSDPPMVLSVRGKTSTTSVRGNTWTGFM